MLLFDDSVSFGWMSAVHCLFLATKLNNVEENNLRIVSMYTFVCDEKHFTAKRSHNLTKFITDALVWKWKYKVLE